MATPDVPPRTHRRYGVGANSTVWVREDLRLFQFRDWHVMDEYP